MSDLNLCQFIGRLGRDPEVRYLPNGDAVCNFSIAVGQQWKDKSGDKKEQTEWVRCNAFAKLAEICGQYLKKGKQVYVSGQMNTRKWTDKDGVEKYTTEIRVNQMQMLGDRVGEKPDPDPANGRGHDADDDIPF
jgi:single-strand DNA-binding protein